MCREHTTESETDSTQLCRDPYSRRLGLTFSRDFTSCAQRFLSAPSYYNYLQKNRKTYIFILAHCFCEHIIHIQTIFLFRLQILGCAKFHLNSTAKMFLHHRNFSSERHTTYVVFKNTQADASKVLGKFGFGNECFQFKLLLLGNSPRHDASQFSTFSLVRIKESIHELRLMKLRNDDPIFLTHSRA